MNHGLGLDTAKPPTLISCGAPTPAASPPSPSSSTCSAVPGSRSTNLNLETEQELALQKYGHSSPPGMSLFDVSDPFLSLISLVAKSVLQELRDAILQSDTLLQHRIRNMDVSSEAQNAADRVCRNLKMLMNLISNTQ